MFNAHKDRGRVLLAVRVHSAKWTLFWWVMSVVLVCLVAFALVVNRHASKRNLQVLPLLVLGLSKIGDYLFHPWIKFQEGGVEIPSNRDYPRVRFMRWNQIRRWSWDGDLLILTGANFQGGAVRIPETQRLAVDQLMGARLAVR